MNVSFQGYNNVIITKSQLFKDGGCLIDGHFKPCRKIDSNYNLSCTLSNDSKGNHLQTFLESVIRWPKIYQQACVKGDKIELSINHSECHADDDIKEVATIMLNGFPIVSYERAGLAIYEYIAKLTTSLMQSTSTSCTQKEFLQEMNEHITKRALDVIDNLP